MSARFLFAATQAGAERPLKNEIARDHPSLRFAFSRPGFVTFRLPTTARPPRSRRSAASSHAPGAIRSAKPLGPDDARLRAPPGNSSRNGAERRGARAAASARLAARAAVCPATKATTPQSAELERAAGAALLEQRPTNDLAGTERQRRRPLPGELVLDCVLVERDEWWLGWHRADSPETRWPGGVPADRAAGAHDLARVPEDRRSAAMVGAARRGRRSLRRDRQLAGRVVPRLARARTARHGHRSGRDGRRRARAPELHSPARAREGRQAQRVPRLPLARHGRERRAELHARHARRAADASRRPARKASCSR